MLMYPAHTQPADPTWRPLSTGLLGAVLLGLAPCVGGGEGGGPCGYRP
ncbi:hypothetical protein [Geothrix alkalitolerans]|nr:hypothetical protein [Geothrix alkalitolerans]